MPVPHLEIRIVQRSKGSSAVAGAAYQAGEKLFSEYDQKMKNYLYKKEVSIVSLAKRTEMQLILFPVCSDCPAKPPL